MFDIYHEHTNQIAQANVTIENANDTIISQNHFLREQELIIEDLQSKALTPEKKRRILTAVIITEIVVFLGGIITGIKLQSF